MSHDAVSQAITYVVVSSVNQPGVRVVKERLQDIYRHEEKNGRSRSQKFVDPFTLHLMVAHETFLEAKAVITDLRYKLYDALDRVDQYSNKLPEQRGRRDLEELTIQLHVVSQDTDSKYASADMANMIMRRISGAHQRYAESIQDMGKKDALEKTADAINYLSMSLESQMRWLSSYKARKDIAMNLVSFPT